MTPRRGALEALAAVNVSLARELDLERLLSQITAAVADLTGAHRVVLWQAEPPARRLVPRATTGHPSIDRGEMPEALGFGHGGTGWVAEHRQPLFIDDITTDPSVLAVDWATKKDVVGFAGVPLLAGDDLVGVLMLNLRRGHRLGDEDRALLSAFASQAALALRNASLFAESESRRRAAETLAGVGRTLARALDPDVVAREVAESVRVLFNALTSSVFRVDAATGDLWPLALAGELGPLRDIRVVPHGTMMAGLAARERRPVSTPNLLTDARVVLTEAQRALLEQLPHRAVLAVPLLHTDAVIGTMSIGDREGRVFTSDEMRLAQAFADQAALALENARLHEQTRLRLRQVDSLREVIEQILVPFSLEERLTLVARKAAELFETERALVALLSDERDALVVRAGHGLEDGEIGQTVPLGEGGLGIAAAGNEGVLINEYQVWPARRLQGGPRQQTVHAILACPLLIRGETIGSLGVGTTRAGRSFVTADLDRLASLAVPAALAIEHSRLYAQLEGRLRELRDTQAQLVQAGKLSAIGQLVSGVAHELNNPLAVVIGYGQLLLRKDPPAEMRGQLEAIVTQADRMAKIVQGLLLFARQRPPERVRLNLADVLSQTLALRATHLRLSGIAVEIECADDLPPVAGDTSQLQQVFLNLLLNAEQAMTDAGVGDCIRLGATTRSDAGGRWVLGQVTDNGPGIPPDVLPRIFEPFFTTKTVGAGTGLGLSVSYGIVEQHGGRIEVESRPGATTFAVALPVTSEEPSPVVRVAAPRRRSSVRAGHALVVDDEAPVAGLIVTLLREAGWTVDERASGDAGLERVRQGSYDLIVSDIRMPDGSGEAFYRAVVAERPDLAARFLFITGDTANAAAFRFLEEMRVAALRKPFTAEDFFQAVDALGE